MNKKIEFLISAENEEERLDKFLARVSSGISRSLIERNIKAGNILVNGQAIKPSYKLRTGDKISGEAAIESYTDIKPQSLDIEIIYEDSDIAIVNKPPGMVVHPAPGHKDGTLVNALLYHIRDLSRTDGIIRAGIVHRLDKDTSGLLVITKNDVAHEQMSFKFQNREIQKKYYALVVGHISNKRGKIIAPIGRSSNDKTKMTIDGINPKAAATQFEVLRYYSDFTLLSAAPKTGRTHQLRVHFLYIGHPIAGDVLYGPKKSKLQCPRQFLHAYFLSFAHPMTGKKVTFEIPLAQDLQNFLDRIE